LFSSNFSAMEICQKHFQRIAKEKSHKMLGVGVGPLTIDAATWIVKIYVNLNGPFTEKQLGYLFSAAISLAQDELIKEGKFKGKKITERELAEIFSADRKTIRKWKTVLKQSSPSDIKSSKIH